MPRIGIPGAKVAAEGRRDGVDISFVLRGLGSPRSKTIPKDSFSSRAGGTKKAGGTKVIQGATKAWMRLGGVNSEDRLREIEWL